MGYKTRNSYPGSDAHVSSRCINYQKSHHLKRKNIKKMFISVVNEANQKYNFKLINYCIMNNHFHMVIHIPKNGDTLSVIMQFIKSVFAKRYNKATKRTGPFWNERYTEKIIQLQDQPIYYFHCLMWYIFNNPVKANLVENPEEYKFSAIKHYLNKNYKDGIDIYRHKYFLQLGNTHEERLKKFLKYKE